MKPKNSLNTIIERMIEKAVASQIEKGMVVRTRKEAIQELEAKWEQLNNHIVKIAMWGDKPNWRTEIRTFAVQIQNIRLKLSKSKRHFTREEHLDAMDDYRNTSFGNMYFKSKFEEINDSFKGPVRDYKEGQKIAYELQMAFVKAFINKEATYGTISNIIDSVLDKYPKM